MSVIKKERENIIQTHNWKKTTGPNSIPTDILHQLKTEISYPLSIIFNISLNTGTHPELLKPAKVIPVFKKGSQLSTSNYRPISVLSNLNKTGNKIALFFTETNSRYFITRAIARVIIVREFVEVKKRHFITVILFFILHFINASKNAFQPSNIF